MFLFVLDLCFDVLWVSVGGCDDCGWMHRLRLDELECDDCHMHRWMIVDGCIDAMVVDGFDCGWMHRCDDCRMRLCLARPTQSVGRAGLNQRYLWKPY